ncbi:murein biosynthesis integral membrane protein MurJ [Tissierella sp. P1]|uniref:murein biosynthesis integral membrane protein MurJ n=1 Tax=Tissierella sp. P1 TaxID=1280483 RepID=UPI000BA17CCA|nr:murein biosynthesis integral membrane protein MurJ [Tissierella sp. P1]OZV13371.1 murein biosynthesis integral membrane protein MurJ [Tissierella sp. P1]
MKNIGTMKSSTLYIIYFGIVTKILLFIKDILTASKIGVNYKMDSYLLALSTIMLITKIVGDGLIVAIIPVLQEIQEKHGEKRRIEYTNNLVNVTVILSFILIIMGYLLAPKIIMIFGPGFKGVELEKTIFLYRVGLPIIMVSWIRSIGGGFLQADHAFRAGAKGGVSNVLVYIIYLIFFAEKFNLTGLMIAGIIAVISQIYILLRTMEKHGYKYAWKLDLKDKYLLKVVKFLLPILIGVGVNELNNSIDNAIASTLPIGSIAELSYANEIVNLFLGLFITAIVTVIFPVLSESHSKKDIENLKAGINHGIVVLLKIAIPVSIILMTMAEPIVKIVFERGAFNAEASFFTAAALGYYAMGLTSMALIPLITRAYYSIHDMKTPVVISILALVVNIIIDLTLAPIMGASGIALGTSASVILSSIIGIYDLNRRLQFTERKDIRGILVKFSVAAVIMTTGILLTYGAFATSLDNVFLHNVITVGLSIAVGLGLYILVCKVLEPMTLYY